MSLSSPRTTSSSRRQARSYAGSGRLTWLLAAFLFATAGALLPMASKAQTSPTSVSSVTSPTGQASQTQMLRQPLVTQTVHDEDRVALHGNRSRLATLAADRGPMSESQPASRMLLLLRRSPDQELALRSFLQSQQNPRSANFHRWLTPQQFGARWGAVDSDLAAVTAWLQSHGFAVDHVSAGRAAIEFSGTIGQVNEAFHTSMRLYSVDGEMHHANARDPEIPAALAPVLAGIATLNDFRPRPTLLRGPTGRFEPGAKHFEPLDAAESPVSGMHPQLTTSTTSGNFLYLGPADAASIYDLPNHALNPAFSGTALDGTGAVIAVAGDSNIDLSQNANYRSLFGVGGHAPTVILDGATDPGVNSDAVEAYLDTEVANGLAPGAQVYLYTAADTNVDYGLDLAIVRAIDDNVADVLSVSFGACEAALGSAGNSFYAALWEQAAAQGISVVVSAGDSGAAGCDDPATETSAIQGLQVNGLASTPDNIAVGGTDFAALAGPDGGGANFANYVSTTNATGTMLSAKGYIPEVPWNESTLTYPPLTLSANVPLPAPYASIAGGGGGASNCAQGGVDTSGNPVCQSGYGKPSWQVAPGVPSDGVRDLPDVALFASNGFFYAAWGICTDQDKDASGNPIVDCTPNSSGQFNIMGVGGTSAAAPAFAAMLALVRQSTGQRQGQADAVLYNLARTSPAIFHDVSTGNNAVSCTASSLNCQQNASGFPFLTGYNAAAGFDLASGLGSVDAAAMIAGWASAPLGSTTTQLTISPVSIQHGQVVAVNATVGASTTPTGSVALVAQNAATPPAQTGSSVGSYPLVSGGSTGNLSLNNLPGGSYNAIASYGGSATLSGSVSQPVAVNVSPESSSTLVNYTALDPATGATTVNAAVPYGFLVSFTAQPYGNRSPTTAGVLEPDGFATGTVQFTLNATALGAQPLGIEGTAATTASVMPTGANSLTAAYSGDPSFNASSAVRSFTVTQAATTLTMTSSATAYTGSAITFTVNLGTDSLGVAPTGVITLGNGSSTVASATILGTGAGQSALASGTATLVVSDPPAGTNTLIASYSGDGNYAASASPGIVIQGKSNFSIAGQPLTVPSTHSTGADTLTLASLSGYAGTVNLTCSVVNAGSATAPPQCALDPATETLAASGTASPLLLVFGAGTKLPSGVSAGSLVPVMSNHRSLLFAAMFLLCLLIGIPARRRAWRSMLSLLVLGLLLSGGLSACGGQGSLITAGSYQIQVTGTDSKDATITSSITISVTVQ